jgi:hypothetical protein
VFTEVFLVQIRRKLQKIHSKIRIQGKKKNFEKHIPNFKINGRKGNSRGKRGVCWGERIFQFKLHY